MAAGCPSQAPALHQAIALGNLHDILQELAAAKEKGPAVLAQLLKLQAPIKLRHWQAGMALTPLQIAVVTDRLVVVEWLMEAGADLSYAPINDTSMEGKPSMLTDIESLPLLHMAINYNRSR